MCNVTTGSKQIFWTLGGVQRVADLNPSPLSPGGNQNRPSPWLVHLDSWVAPSVPQTLENHQLQSFLLPDLTHVNQAARPEQTINLCQNSGSGALTTRKQTVAVTSEHWSGCKKRMMSSVCPATDNPRTAGCAVAWGGQGHYQHWIQAAAPLSHWHFITNNRLWSN